MGGAGGAPPVSLSVPLRLSPGPSPAPPAGATVAPPGPRGDTPQGSTPSLYVRWRTKPDIAELIVHILHSVVASGVAWRISTASTSPRAAHRSTRWKAAVRDMSPSKYSSAYWRELADDAHA